MSFEAFLKTAQKQPSPSSSPFVEGVCRNVTVDGVYFTVPAWDSGRHVFGPVVSPTGTAPGDRLLVIFQGGDPWILAKNPAGAVATSSIDIVGGTDIGAALADGDIFPVYDLSATANRGSTLSRIATWLFAKVSGDITTTSAGVAAIASNIIVDADINTAAAIADTKLATIATANKVSVPALNIAGGTDIGAALADGDIIPVYDLSATANRGSALSRIATYIFSKVSSHLTMTSAGVATIANAVLKNIMLSTVAGEPGAAMLTSTYTPTITNGTINLGTGVARSGEYIQIGKIVIGRANITLGTTGFNKGSGLYEFSLPVAPMITGYSTSLCIGTLRISAMTSAHIANFHGSLILSANGMQFRYPSAYPNGTSVSVGSDSPVAVIASQRFEYFFIYEAA